MVLITALFKVLSSSFSKYRKPTFGFYLNIILGAGFLIFRKFPPVCSYSINDDGDICRFSWKELETYLFLLIVITFKNRTAISFEQVVINALMFTKLVNIVLFYRVDYRLAFIYGMLCLMRMWLFYDDFVEGKENTTYFNHVTLEEHLKEHPEETWMILFYTTWTPKCTAIFPVFAELSETYSTQYLKFGKVDIGKYPEAGLKYGVNPKATSAQLPSIIVFEEGKMTNWRPCIGAKKNLVKYVFSQENIVRDFALAKLTQTSEERGSRKKPKKDKKND